MLFLTMSSLISLEKLLKECKFLHTSLLDVCFFSYCIAREVNIIPRCPPYAAFVRQMIVEPEQRVPDFIKAGADIVSVHCENASTIHLHRTINQAHPPSKN